ncbi:hypothetical protein [Proteiniclasticum ruminis]|uniref:hypothetical protein n=1 Tax=Proteiniclasticum ruminis TaxID=398199 RepID=UPI0028A90B8D|nr:hypothetical protein [Proteiniclasticum ruminis]
MIKRKEMTGGLVIIEGPVNDGNSALDYNGSFSITGGTLLALGSSGMAMNVSETSTQGAFLLNGKEVAAGETLVIKTSSGEELFSYTTEKNSASLLFSSEDLKQGETYEVYSEGKELSEVSMTSLMTTRGTSGMTPGGGNNPGGGKIPGGRP